MSPPRTPAASRRTLLRLGPAALLYALAARRALAEPIQGKVFEGLRAMNDLALALRHGELLPSQWQDQMARTVATLDVAEAAQTLELDRLAATLELPDDRARVREISFPALDQALREAGVRLRLFALGTGRAIVPHGHQGMASMHWILRGALHGRHFDRVELSPTHVIMRPTIDAVLGPGAATSISDERDNIHWFVAVEGPAFTLDVIVSHLQPIGREDRSHQDNAHGRFYVDPRAAEELGDGCLRAPRLSPERARLRYGRG